MVFSESIQTQTQRSRGFPRYTQRKCPSYLYRHASGYIFRIRVPCDIRPFLGGKTEFRQSLRTGALGEAKYRTRVMAAHAQRTFRNIRNGGDMKELTPDQINDLLQHRFKQALDDYEDMKVNRTRPATDEQLDAQTTAYQFQQSDHREQLARGD